jgi:formylglycine-generating enzyme required for sulfatase activity
VSPGDLLFGRFRVVEELGRGGMGVVYKATDAQLNDRVVAVKLLAAHLATDASAVARLKQEVIAAQGLQHPGVVRINTFHAEQGQAGFDMEYLDGATLAQHLSGDVPGSPFGPPATIERLPFVAGLVTQLAEVLDLIHGKDLVHRDIKPSNVMLVPRNDGGFAVKLLDFGIVHVEGGDLTGMVQPGTLSYMAPELVNGTGQASPASDLFALGAIVYLAITGEFSRFGPESDQPSSKVAGLPSSVDDPILSCLAARPDRRPKSAAALAGAVRAAAPRDPQPRPGRSGLSGALVAVVVVIGIVLVAVVGPKLFGGDETPPGPLVQTTPGEGTLPPGPAPLEPQTPAPSTLALGGEVIDQHGYELVTIEPGEFWMGSPSDEEDRVDDETRHRVRLTRGYALGATEVTQGLYEAVMGENPSSFKGDDRPVERVSWLEAVKFCNALSEREGLTPAYLISEDTRTWTREADGYRLPTESEWEYAARGGGSHLYSGSDDLGAVGWYSSNSSNTTHDVGSKRANGYGLYDMSGNVWEWVWDWYGGYRTVPDPTGSSTGSYRVYRGGSWYDNPRNARVANRYWVVPGYRYSDLGFRLARSIALAP